jgi:UDPglucose 6-dehydrogenase/GDP-mannose 6-dehydrogenase
MKVSVVGAGYVGLVTGVCLAERGHSVTCVDLDREKVDRINRAIPPIHEPGLRELLARHVNRDFWASVDLEDAVLSSGVTVIAVGTPFDGREIDLSAVKAAAAEIGTVLRSKSSYHVVVVKSTVVPGTTDGVVLPILEGVSGKRAGEDFGLGMNPEFLTEGQAVEDFLSPDRIVLGGIDERSVRTLADLYQGFAGVEMIRTTTKTAEMIKYASNALLATAISFSNELANLCATLGGIDVVDVMRGVHRSRYLTVRSRAGEQLEAPLARFLEAGCGFGGSCLPKDVNALIAQAERAGCSMEVLRAVMRVNEQQPQRLVALLRNHFSSLAGLRVAVLGLAFKPDTADVRESPALPIIRRLLVERARVKAHDPVANAEARKVFPNGDLELCDDLAHVVQDVDAVVLVTGWESFRELPEVLNRVGAQPLVVDGRRMLDRHAIARYAGIGL